MHRLKQKEIAYWRDKLYDEQNGICPLCGTFIEPDEAVLDHDHDTGVIRATLHRSCNGSEGRILTFASTRCRSEDPEQFLRNLIKYWDTDFSHLPLHPTHKTDEEKEIKRLKKKLKTLKRESTIQQTKQEIKRLTEVVKAQFNGGK